MVSPNATSGRRMARHVALRHTRTKIGILFQWIRRHFDPCFPTDENAVELEPDAFGEGAENFEILPEWAGKALVFCLVFSTLFSFGYEIILRYSACKPGHPIIQPQPAAPMGGSREMAR